MRKKSFLILFLMTVMGVNVVLPVFSQDATVRQSNRFLGVLFKLEKMRDDAVAQKTKADNTIAQARALITRARQGRDTRAEQMGQQALAVAGETKAKAEWKIKRTDEAIARVRNLAARMTGNGEVRAVVTEHSGDVRYFSKKLDRSMSMDDGRAGLLEPDDEIWTLGDGSAHLKFLDGRAGLSLGPYSKVRMEEDDQGDQIADLMEGKLYLTVDKLDDYRRKIEEKLRSLKDDLATVATADMAEISEAYENLLKLHSAEAKQRFEVRTPAAVCAVRGTRFLVTEDRHNGTTVTVLEGLVEVTAANGRKTVTVTGGQTTLISVDGKMDPPESVEVKTITPWWSED